MNLEVICRSNLSVSKLTISVSNTDMGSPEKERMKIGNVVGQAPVNNRHRSFFVFRFGKSNEEYK